LPNLNHDAISTSFPFADPFLGVQAATFAASIIPYWFRGPTAISGRVPYSTSTCFVGRGWVGVDYPQCEVFLRTRGLRCRDDELDGTAVLSNREGMGNQS
jgi:hypothetical protein